MKRRFEDILTCAQVMEAGTVTAAAKRLNLSKSVISKRISDLEAALHGCLRVTMPISFGTIYLGPVIAKFAQALRVAVMKLPYASTAQAHSALRCYLVFARTCRQVGIALFPGRWMLREATEVLCNQKGTCRIGIR